MSRVTAVLLTLLALPFALAGLVLAAGALAACSNPSPQRVSASPSGAPETQFLLVLHLLILLVVGLLGFLSMGFQMVASRFSGAQCSQTAQVCELYAARSLTSCPTTATGKQRRTSWLRGTRSGPGPIPGDGLWRGCQTRRARPGARPQ